MSTFDFLQAKYDKELQEYLTTNGLQASDLVKPRSRKRDRDKSSSGAPAQPAVQENQLGSGSNLAVTPEQMAEEMARTILESAGMAGDAGRGFIDYGKNKTEDNANGFLPHFSQVTFSLCQHVVSAAVSWHVLSRHYTVTVSLGIQYSFLGLH